MTLNRRVSLIATLGALVGAAATAAALLLLKALGVLASGDMGSAMAAALGAGLASGVMFAALARYAVRPWQMLTKAAGVSSADPEQLAALTRRADEVGAVAQSIRAMQQRLEHRNAALTQAYLTVMESEQRLAGIIDHLIEGFLVVEGDGVIARANPAANRTFGHPPGGLSGVHVEHLGWDVAELESAATSGEGPGPAVAASAGGDPTLVLSRTLSSGTVPVELGVTRVEQDGRVQYCVLVRDLTARREMERELRESREFLDRLVELLPVAIFLKEADTMRFRLVNRAMEALTGSPRSALIGSTYDDFSRLSADLVGEFASVERQIADGDRESATVQYELPTRNGRRTVRGTSIPIRNECGRVTHLLGVVEDLSEQISVQNALEQARARAEAANQAKSEFLANMSHELRTPLSAIIGYSEILDEMAREQGREQESLDLQRIIGAARHLLTLINEILDLGRSETGQLQRSYGVLDVDRLVDDVRDVVQPLMEQNGNRLVIEGSTSGPCVSDQSMLRTVLAHLLSNAAKFSRNGRVTLRYQVDGQGARFEVHDTGIGMTAEAQSRVFEPFVQVDASTSREYGGTGLGLTLCRRYCEHLGGSIGLTSIPGKGTSFTVTVPCSCPPPAVEPERRMSG